MFPGFRSFQTQNKKPLKLPNVLMLNCGLDTEHGREFWRKQSDGGKKQWVPLGIKMSVSDDGQLVVKPFNCSKEDKQVSSRHSAFFPQITFLSQKFSVFVAGSSLLRANFYSGPCQRDVLYAAWKPCCSHSCR